MNCLYTMGDVFTSPDQMIVYGITTDNHTCTEEQKRAAQAFPEAADLLRKVFTQVEQSEEDKQLPEIGDVVWSYSGGGRTVAHGVMYDHGKLREDALRVVLQCVKRKAHMHNINTIGIPVIGSVNQWFGRWKDVVEEELDDVQPIVYCIDEQQLLEVLDRL